MKKSLFLAIFILVSLSAFSQEAFIDQLIGTVEIKHPKENSFKTANKGDKLFQETVLSTSFKSFAIVKIGSSIITVRPLTILSLAEIQKQEETETLNVNLQTGRVRVEVKPPAGTKTFMNVSSPSAVASVRGTAFELDTHNIYVNEGTVSFIGNKGQNVFVRAGENSRVNQAEQATTPREERKLNLLPKNPVGTSMRDSPNSGSSGAGMNFTIEFKFY